MVTGPTRAKPSAHAASSSPAKIRTGPGSTGATMPARPMTTSTTARNQSTNPLLRRGWPGDGRHQIADADDPGVRLHVVVPLPDRGLGAAAADGQAAAALVGNGLALRRPLLPRPQLAGERDQAIDIGARHLVRLPHLG